MISGEVYNGFFYEISRGEEVKGYLFGSIHIADCDEESLTLNRSVMDAFKKSALFVEYHPSKFTDICRLWQLRNKIFNKNSISENGFFAGVDQKFIAETRINFRCKRINSLETLDFQVKCLEYLNKSENSFDVGKNKEYFKKMIDLYKRGEKREFRKLCFDPLSDEEKRELLFDRNRRMAVRIDDVIQKGDLPFVVVGSSHLFGKDESLKGQLKLCGWSVKRVKS